MDKFTHFEKKDEEIDLYVLVIGMKLISVWDEIGIGSKEGGNSSYHK